MSSKICVAIPAFRLQQTLDQVKALSAPDIIEIRFDYRKELIDINAIREATDIPLIATNRCKEQGGYARETESDRIDLILEACKAGYEYADIELTTENLSQVIKEIKETGSKCIVSHHDFKATPSRRELTRLHDEAKSKGADIVKLIGTANKEEDNLEYLEFLKQHPGNISFGMSRHGIISRLASPLMGGAFTYASAVEGKESAPGQLTIKEMRSIYMTLEVDQ
ncbi:MAG: type I 3-dehydroquinate dehydratase [Candidatus Bathyarchaeota archaeon]|nr:type I 3-dehydroquinate dehydratase [Candidatus Bathyarchaeota archaeon]